MRVAPKLQISKNANEATTFSLALYLLIMLESQKRFDNDYILDSAKVFDLLRKKSKVFNWKMFFSLLVITMVLISIFVVAIYIVK